MADNEVNVENVADELLKVLQKAIRQSNSTIVKNKKKTVSTEYDEELKKPMCETTEESEELTKLKGTVDINALKTLTGLLKEVHAMVGSEEIAQTEEDNRGIIVLADVKKLENEE